MARELKKPESMPERGYYYHYKHDPNGPVNNYAYFIDGVACHTEDDCRPVDQFLQIYRPLYESYIYGLGIRFDARPVGMFYEPASVDGKEVPRFVRITDEGVIAQLRDIRHTMYGED